MDILQRAQSIDTTKELYTTGEAADICSLSQQTIIRCFDSGRLRGFRIPGSKLRKIPRDSLLRFMKENSIPMGTMEDGKMRVLVVDDDPQIVELFVDVLEADDRFEVATAQTGYDAGVMTHQFRPDIVVLDYMLPDINGRDVLRSIKANPGTSHIRIIAISGMIEQDKISELYDAGIELYLQKPFDLQELVSTVRKLAAKG